MRKNYTLPRLFIDEPLNEDRVLTLSKSQSHYVMTVLRSKIGASLRIFNSQDGEWRADVETLSKRAVSLKLKERLRAPYASPDIGLYFSPLRKHRNSFILEKGTELGAGFFQPVIMERTQFPKIRMDKMNAQIIEAAEQTERLDLPLLKATVSLESVIASWDDTRLLIMADESQEAPSARIVLKSVIEFETISMGLMVGPEGGFTSKERDLLASQSFVRRVSLGPRILRADTAALALLSLCQAHCGDWA